VLWNDINPGIAAHGGECNLIEITEDKIAILSFGGGCQGCAQVDMTLKYGVEEQLVKAVPELKGIRDITDHSDTSNAFY
jgi:Fe/S biogenesis protein NfuA